MAECEALDVVFTPRLVVLELCGYNVAECHALEVVLADIRELLLWLADLTGCEWV